MVSARLAAVINVLLVAVAFFILDLTFTVLFRVFALVVLCEAPLIDCASVGLEGEAMY